MQPRALLAAYIIAFLGLWPIVATGDCGGKAPVARGKCVPYHGVCSSIVGTTVWSNETFPIDDSEAVLVDILTTLRSQKALIPPECEHASDWYACGEIYMQCIETDDGEGIPVLPCASDCGMWWDVCRTAFDLYYTSVLHGDTTTAEVTMCTNGATFSAEQADPAYVPDTFGGRPFPISNFWPLGYNGTLRWPDGAATYVLSNGSQVATQCFTLVKPSAALELAKNVTCLPPLLGAW